MLQCHFNATVFDRQYYLRTFEAPNYKSRSLQHNWSRSPLSAERREPERQFVIWLERVNIICGCRTLRCKFVKDLPCDYLGYRSCDLCSWSFHHSNDNRWKLRTCGRPAANLMANDLLLSDERDRPVASSCSYIDIQMRRETNTRLRY